MDLTRDDAIALLNQHVKNERMDNIMECERIGIPINEFAELCINAMMTVSDRIGL